MAVNAIALKGVTTLKWGTLSVVGSPSGAIVESISVTPKNQGLIGEVENGDGATLTMAMLSDGFDCDVSMAYDSSKTWPAEGDTVAMTLNKTGAAGGTQAFNCLLVSMPQQFQRKGEAKISFKLAYRPGVTLS